MELDYKRRKLKKKQAIDKTQNFEAIIIINYYLLTLKIKYVHLSLEWKSIWSVIKAKMLKDLKKKHKYWPHKIFLGYENSYYRTKKTSVMN